MRLTFGSAILPYSFTLNPSLAIDAQGNVHVVWEDYRSGDWEIYYKKLDNNGNTLINDTRLTFAIGDSVYPSLGIDSQGNVHVTWIDRRSGYRYVYYKKLDNNGNTLVNERVVNFYISVLNFPPSLAIDAQGNVHVVWTTGTGVSGYGDIFYTKLDNNGNTLVNAMEITYTSSYSQNPFLDADSQGDIYVVWEEHTNGPSNIYYKKLNNSGGTLINDTRLNFNRSFSPSLIVDSQDNVYFVWMGSIIGYKDIYYTKLDNNGNTFINNTKLTFNNVIYPYINPSLAVDSQDNVHVAWVGLGYPGWEIYYKRSLSSNQNTLSSVRLVGTPAPGSTVSLQLNSPLNTNQNYIFGLALGTSLGFNLGNHHIPLNPDFLLSATFTNPSSAGLSNSMGTLNANGQATVSLTVPNLPWLSGWTVYGGFITFDSQGHITGISEPVRINIF